jgi:hypothetical protein
LSFCRIDGNAPALGFLGGLHGLAQRPLLAQVVGAA